MSEPNLITIFKDMQHLERQKVYDRFFFYLFWLFQKGYELDRQPKAAKDFISKMQSGIVFFKKFPKKLQPNKDLIKLNADKNAFKSTN